jgi:hypothetical protein
VDEAFSVPVYLGGVTDISARDVSDDERDFPRLACARQHYEDNFDPRTGGQYLELAKKGYMIPVAAACYAQDPGPVHGILAE